MTVVGGATERKIARFCVLRLIHCTISPPQRRDNDIQRRRRFYERLSLRNPSPFREKDFVEEAKIQRRRRTRGEHKGNRSHHRKPTNHPPATPLSSLKEKRKATEG